MSNQLFCSIIFALAAFSASAQDLEARYYQGLGSTVNMAVNLSQGNAGLALQYGKEASEVFYQIGFYELYLKSSNAVARVYLQQNQVDSASQIVERNLKLLAEVEQGGGAKGGTYFISGATFLTQGKTDSAIYYLQKARTIYDTLSNYLIATEYLPDSLTFVTDSYYSGFNKMAVTGNKDLSLARVYNYLGLAYMSTLEFKRAHAFLKKALFHYQRTNNYPEQFSVLINLGQAILGNVNEQQERFDSAMVYFNRALTLAEQGGEQALVFKGAVKRFITLTALHFQRPELAALHYPEADSILSNSNKEVLAKLATLPPEGLDLSLLVEKAWVYASIDQPAKAREVLDETPQYFKEFEQTGTFQKGDFMAQTAIRQAETYALLQDWPEAHRFGRIALKALGINYGEDYAAPVLEAEGVRPQPQLTDVKTILAVAEIFEQQAQSNNDRASWESAYLYYQLAGKYIDQSRYYYLGVTGQTFFNEQALFNADYLVRRINSALISIGFELSRPADDEVLQHFEKGKAFVLRNAIEQLQQVRTIPDSLLRQDRNFRDRLQQVHAEMISAKNDPAGLTGLNEQWLNIQKEYEEFVGQFSTQFPDLYTLQRGADIPSIEQAQTLLPDEHSAIVEYHFVDETELYIFWLQKDKVGLERVDLPKNFPGLLKDYKAIIGSDLDAEDPDKVKAYLSCGHQLYQLLLHSVLEQLSEVDHLIIIPDQSLHELEFDYLLTRPLDLEETTITEFTDAPRYDQLLLLVFEYSTQYVNSMAALLTLDKLNYQAAAKEDWRDYGIFQPDFENFSWKRELPDFPFNGQDTVLYNLLDIKDLLKEAPPAREAWVKAAATEFNFRRAVSSYDFNILHIYSHGLLHPNDPLASAILLAKSADLPVRDRIKISDLYTLPLKANLTIVNSCNSGNSEVLLGGEGLISMGRGFFYAGSPSLILGRWSIPMGSTNAVTQRFLKELKAGYSVSKALQKAKIQYLENRSVGPFQKAPFYWAALSHWGKDQSLSF